MLLGARLPEKMRSHGDEWPGVGHDCAWNQYGVGKPEHADCDGQAFWWGAFWVSGGGSKMVLKAVGRWLEDRFGGNDDAASGRSITRAFVTASLVFCVGPLTMVGSIMDGLTGDYQPLAIKSVLDGFASLAFGASLGPGVLFSAVTVLIYQGGLSVGAHLLGGSLGEISAETPAVIEMGATGGVLIIGHWFDVA